MKRHLLPLFVRIWLLQVFVRFNESEGEAHTKKQERTLYKLKTIILPLPDPFCRSILYHVFYCRYIFLFCTMAIPGKGIKRVKIVEV